jgi:hypothetical protein
MRVIVARSKFSSIPPRCFQVTEFTACLRRNLLCLMKRTIGTADDCLIRENLIVHPTFFPKLESNEARNLFIPFKCKKATLVAKRKVSFKKYPTPVRRGRSPALQGVSCIPQLFLRKQRNEVFEKMLKRH